jgi:hypothetical protein
MHKSAEMLFSSAARRSAATKKPHFTKYHEPCGPTRVDSGGFDFTLRCTVTVQ